MPESLEADIVLLYYALVPDLDKFRKYFAEDA